MHPRAASEEQKVSPFMDDSWNLEIPKFWRCASEFDTTDWELDAAGLHARKLDIGNGDPNWEEKTG